MNACLVAGTRGALDFVEIPSHVMEYWARDYRVVKEWAIDENGECSIAESEVCVIAARNGHIIVSL